MWQLASLVATAFTAGRLIKANTNVLIAVRFVRILELHQAAVLQAAVGVECVSALRDNATDVCFDLLAVGAFLLYAYNTLFYVHLLLTFQLLITEKILPHIIGFRRQINSHQVTYQSLDTLHLRSNVFQ